MITLCIANCYYVIGLFRVERFPDMAHVEQFRRSLDPRTQTWLAGEPIPKKRDLEFH